MAKVLKLSRRMTKKQTEELQKKIEDAVFSLQAMKSHLYSNGYMSKKDLKERSEREERLKNGKASPGDVLSGLEDFFSD